MSSSGTRENKISKFISTKLINGSVVDLLIKRCDTSTLQWSHLTKNRQFNLSKSALNKLYIGGRCFSTSVAKCFSMFSTYCMFLTGSIGSWASHVGITVAKNLGIGYFFASFFCTYLWPTYLKKLQEIWLSFDVHHEYIEF